MDMPKRSAKDNHSIGPNVRWSQHDDGNQAYMQYNNNNSHHMLRSPDVSYTNKKATAGKLAPLQKNPAHMMSPPSIDDLSNRNAINIPSIE